MARATNPGFRPDAAVERPIELEIAKIIRLQDRTRCDRLPTLSESGRFARRGRELNRKTTIFTPRTSPPMGVEEGLGSLSHDAEGEPVAEECQGAVSQTLDEPKRAWEEQESSSRNPPKRIVGITDPVRYVSDHAYIPGLTSSHFEYLITSVDDNKTHTVRRRFSDFLHLADVLSETHRGYFIFPCPEKGTLDAAAAGRTEAEFIEFRRVDLERYLIRLCEHPVISRSDELAVFLETEGSLASSVEWRQVVPLRPTVMDGVLRLPGQLFGSDSTVPTVQDVKKNSRNTNDIMRMMKEAMLKEESQGEVPGEEMAWRQTRERIEQYSECLVAASTSSERLVRESERLSIAMGDIGLSLIRMAKYEDDHGSPSGCYSPFASTTRAMAEISRRCGMELAKLSKMERHATEDRVVALEPINNLLAMAQSATSALRERECAFVTMRSVQDDLSKAQLSLNMMEKVHAVATLRDPVGEKKLAALRNDVAGLEAALRVASTTYETLLQRNKDDYARWRKLQIDDAKAINVDLSKVMLRHGNVVAKEAAGMTRDLRHAGERER